MDKRRRSGKTSARAMGVAALAIAGTLSLGVMAAPVVSFAATTSETYPFPDTHYGDGTITIKQASPNSGTKYNGYRIVKAVVTTGSDSKDKAIDTQWEGDSVKTAVLAYLDQSGYGTWLTTNGHTAAVNGVAAHDIAQNAVDFISERIGYAGGANASATAQNTNTNPRTTDGLSFANGLARAIVASGITPTVAGQDSDAAYTGKQGYYLFVTQNTSTNSDIIGVSEAGTAPIWVALSGTQAKIVNEKSSTPTIEKKVKEDSSGAWGDAADANKGQLLDFKLTASLPNNVTAYEKYHLLFTDRMTNLEMASNSLKVYVDSTEVKAAGYTVSYPSNNAGNPLAITDADKQKKLTVEIPDVRSLQSTTDQAINVTATSVVRVEYQASLTNNAVMGSTGNPNTVLLTYSSDPNVTWDGANSPGHSHDDTPEDTVKVYTYGIELTKVDQETREKLPDTEFVIKVASGNSDSASVGKYLAQDGSLAEATDATAYKWKTDANGKITVPRIDEGTYTIHEVTATADHKLLNADITLVITSTFNAENLSALSATVAGGNNMWGGSASTVPQSSANPVTNADQDGIFAVPLSEGQVQFRVSNKKETYLPGTGLTLDQAGLLFGAICVALGLGGIVYYRKSRTEDEKQA